MQEATRGNVGFGGEVKPLLAQRDAIHPWRCMKSNSRTKKHVYLFERKDALFAPAAKRAPVSAAAPPAPPLPARHAKPLHRPSMKNGTIPR